MGISLERNTIIKGRYVVDMQSPTQHKGYITYYCTDKQTESRVMIKEFFPEYATRDESGNLEYSLNQEKDMNDFNESHQLARKFGTLPTVVAVYDIFTENNTLYAVCEYVQGRVVNKLWAKGSGFTFSSVQRVIVNLLRTNEALGRFGMYHADFSPENVIITNDGCVKINKFNPIAEPQAEKDAIKSVASLGYFMLSGGYLSKVKSAPKVSGASNAKRLAAYLKYIYLNDNIILTTSKILEDSSRNFDVKLSANFASKHTGKPRSVADVSVRKGSQNTNFFSQMSLKTKLLAIGIPVLALLTLVILGFISSNNANKADTVITSIKYSIDNVNYTELLIAENSETAQVTSDADVQSDAELNSDANNKSGVEKLFENVFDKSASNYNFLKQQTVELKLGKDEIKNSSVLYLDIAVPSDSSCKVTVKHNGEDILPTPEKSGKYKVDIGNEGKIVIESTSPHGLGLFDKTSKYTITYTRKVLAKLGGIEYSVDSSAFMPVSDFNPDVATCSINTSDTAKEIIIRLNKDSGLERTFAVNGTVQSNGVIDVTPGDEPRTIIAVATISDPSGNKEANTYTININVPAKPIPVEDTEITIPNVVGKSEASARASIKSAGGNVKLAYTSHKTVKKGNVIKQSVNGKAKKGVTVTLTISTGNDDTPTANPTDPAKAAAQEKYNAAKAAADTAKANKQNETNKLENARKASSEASKYLEGLSDGNPEKANAKETARQKYQEFIDVEKAYREKEGALNKAIADAEANLRAAEEELAKYN